MEGKLSDCLTHNSIHESFPAFFYLLAESCQLSFLVFYYFFLCLHSSCLFRLSITVLECELGDADTADLPGWRGNNSGKNKYPGYRLKKQSGADKRQIKLRCQNHLPCSRECQNQKGWHSHLHLKVTNINRNNLL